MEKGIRVCLGVSVSADAHDSGGLRAEFTDELVTRSVDNIYKSKRAEENFRMD